MFDFMNMMRFKLLILYLFLGFLNRILKHLFIRKSILTLNMFITLPFFSIQLTLKQHLIIPYIFCLITEQILRLNLRVHLLWISSKGLLFILDLFICRLNNIRFRWTDNFFLAWYESILFGAFKSFLRTFIALKSVGKIRSEV